MHLTPAVLDAAIQLLDCGNGVATRALHGKVNGWNNLTGGEAGIRTLLTRVCKLVMARRTCGNKGLVLRWLQRSIRLLTSSSILQNRPCLGDIWRRWHESAFAYPKQEADFSVQNVAVTCLLGLGKGRDSFLTASRQVNGLTGHW